MYCAVLHVRALFCSLQYIITMFLTGGWFFSLNQFTLSSFYHCFCKIFLHNTHEYTLTWWCRPFFTYMSWIKHTHPAADWKFISLTERIFPKFIIWIKLFDVMPLKKRITVSQTRTSWKNLLLHPSRGCARSRSFPSTLNICGGFLLCLVKLGL